MFRRRTSSGGPNSSSSRPMAMRGGGNCGNGPSPSVMGACSRAFIEMHETAASLLPLEDALGHHFAKGDLLIEALTHPSAVRRRGISKRGYERLEFLGDRVLGLIVAELLGRRFPTEAEGELTRRQTHRVRRPALAAAA